MAAVTRDALSSDAEKPVRPSSRALLTLEYSVVSRGACMRTEAMWGGVVSVWRAVAMSPATRSSIRLNINAEASLSRTTGCFGISARGTEVPVRHDDARAKPLSDAALRRLASLRAARSWRDSARVSRNASRDGVSAASSRSAVELSTALKKASDSARPSWSALAVLWAARCRSRSKLSSKASSSASEASNIPLSFQSARIASFSSSGSSPTALRRLPMSASPIVKL